MSDNSVHHAALSGIGNDHDAMSGNSYDPHFEEVISRVEDHHQTSGLLDGPLEAYMAARARFSKRMHQAAALVELLKEHDTRRRFASMNDTLQGCYLEAVADLIAAARIDGEVAIGDAEQRL